MKLPQLLLTVVLVAVGILAYDLLRSPEGGDAVSTLERPDGAPALEPDSGHFEASPPVLDGTGDDHKLQALERRLATLEALIEASGMDVEAMLESVGSGSGNGSGSEEGPGDGSGAGSADTGPQPENGGWELNPSPFSKQDLQHFRKKLEWTERQRKLEHAGREIWKWINRQGVKLEPEQQREVVIHALRFQAKVRKLKGEKGKSDEAKKAEGAKLGDQFRDQLFDIVPSTEALRIIDALDRQQAEAEARRAQNK